MPTLNLTSMIDVLFLLIIFFMVGTKFVESERQIELSRVHAQVEIRREKQTAEESARLVIGKFVPFLLRVIEDRR